MLRRFRQSFRLVVPNLHNSKDPGISLCTERHVTRGRYLGNFINREPTSCVGLPTNDTTAWGLRHDHVTEPALPSFQTGLVVVFRLVTRIHSASPRAKSCETLAATSWRLCKLVICGRMINVITADCRVFYRCF